MTDALKQTTALIDAPRQGGGKKGRKPDAAGFQDALRTANRKSAIEQAQKDKDARIDAGRNALETASKMKAQARMAADTELSRKVDDADIRGSNDDVDTDAKDDDTSIAPVDVLLQFDATLERIRQRTNQSEAPSVDRSEGAEPVDDPEHGETRTSVEALEVKPDAKPSETGAGVKGIPALGEPKSETADTKPAAQALQVTGSSVAGATAAVTEPKGRTAIDSFQSTLARTLAMRDGGTSEIAPLKADPPQADGKVSVQITVGTNDAPGDAATEDGAGRDDQSQKEAPENRRLQPQSQQTRATVDVSATALPAGSTVITPPGANATAVASAISNAATAQPASESVAEMLLRMSSSSGDRVQSLKVQLHPAELGMVTAQLRFAEDQLSVELHVENMDAYHRLSADMDSITKSLKSIGLNVDQVTLQQPQGNVQATVRADVGGNAGSNLARDQSSFQSWGSAGGEGRTGGQAAGGGRGHNGNQGDNRAPSRQNARSSGLYI